MINKFDYRAEEISLNYFAQILDEYGWIAYENAIEPSFLEEITASLDSAYAIRREIQIMNGIADNMSGTLHHLIGRNSFAIKFLRNAYCSNQIRYFLKGNYILNSLGAVVNTKEGSRYVQHIHRDIRSFTGDYKMMIQMIVVLDDFTIENGATYFLSGSHKCETKPDQDFFFEYADRAIVKKGSIIIFDSNLWHAAGLNYTDRPRRALTMAFTRPFFKPQLDYPRFLGYDYVSTLDNDLKQVLGYKARIPENLEEYYQPVESRMYQPDQG